MDNITDVWFRSSYSLSDIAEILRFVGPHHDSEDYWEWIIGTLDGAVLDLTRAHQLDPADGDTRVFRLDNLPLEADLLRTLATRLLGAGVAPVMFGKWVHTTGNSYELLVKQVIGPNHAFS